MNRKRIVMVFCICSVLLFAFIIIDSIKTPTYCGNVPKVEKMILWADGWTYGGDGRSRGIGKLPTTLLHVGGVGAVSNVLPRTINRDTVLVMKNQYQDMEVFIDGELRYSYLGQAQLEHRRKDAHFYCVVDLEQRDQEKLVVVSATALGNSVIIPEFRLGTEAELILEFYQENIGTMLFSCFMLFVGTFMILLYFRQKHMEIRARRMFAYLGILMLICGVGVFMESSLTQIYFKNEALAFLISINLFLLFPFPMLAFLYLMVEKKIKIFEGLAVVTGINFFGQNILYLANIYSFVEMILFTHGMYFVMILILVYMAFTVKVEESTPTTRWFFRGSLLFLFFAALDVFHLLQGAPMEHARYLRYGMIFFIIIMIWLSARRIFNYLETEVESRVYKKMAFLDTLTKLPNRNAMEKCMEEMERGKKKYGRLSLVLLDVNGLKPVNDTMGHEAGDILLTEAARCIQAAFPEAGGHCYRLGGDEFLVILIETQLSEAECRERLRKTTCKLEGAIPVSISCGCSTAEMIRVSRVKMSRLMSEADEKMYAHKQYYYNNL